MVRRIVRPRPPVWMQRRRSAAGPRRSWSGRSWPRCRPASTSPWASRPLCPCPPPPPPPPLPPLPAPPCPWLPPPSWKPPARPPVPRQPAVAPREAVAQGVLGWTRHPRPLLRPQRVPQAVAARRQGPPAARQSHGCCLPLKVVLPSRGLPLWRRGTHQPHSPLCPRCLHPPEARRPLPLHQEAPTPRRHPACHLPLPGQAPWRSRHHPLSEHRPCQMAACRRLLEWVAAAAAQCRGDGAPSEVPGCAAGCLAQGSLVPHSPCGGACPLGVGIVGRGGGYGWWVRGWMGLVFAASQRRPARLCWLHCLTGDFSYESCGACFCVRVWVCPRRGCL
jgi:hypothetical protein